MLYRYVLLLDDATYLGLLRLARIYGRPPEQLAEDLMRIGVSAPRAPTRPGR